MNLPENEPERRSQRDYNHGFRLAVISPIGRLL